VVLQFGKIHDRFTEWSRLGHLVGNGPFRLAKWRLHDFIEVRRNPHYWDAAKVWLDAVRFLPIENPYTEARAFLAGQLHTTYALPPDLIPEIRRSTPRFLHQEPYIGTTILRINTARSALGDPKVRRALSLAIDRSQICRHILEGYTPAQSLTPPMGSYHAEPALRHDPEEARRLLAEAGFPGGKGFPRFTMLISRPSARAVTEALQGMWKQELGILVDIQNKDWGSYLSAQRKLDYDMAWGSWIGDYLDPTTFLNLWTSGNGNNKTGWANHEYETLLRQAAHSPDPAQRFATLRRAERLLMDAQPVIPVSWYARNYLHAPCIQGWHPLLLDNHPWKSIRFVQ
jgi:oligopeptide transport system substrate-binding protein